MANYLHSRALLRAQLHSAADPPLDSLIACLHFPPCPSLQYLPGTFSSVHTRPRTESFFNGYLASAVLLVCLMGAPYAFRALAKLQGSVSASEVEASVSLQFFWLLIMDVFFGSAVIEALFRQLDNVLHYFSLAEIINSIALSVPAVRCSLPHLSAQCPLPRPTPSESSPKELLSARALPRSVERNGLFVWL